ncbi:MAG: MFS transporter [Candidatus Heimdallarchaeota archaeon]
MSEEVEDSGNMEQEEEIPQNGPFQKRLFGLISIGYNSSQLILLNFLTYFAAQVGVTKTVMGFITGIRNLAGSLLQERVGRLSDRRGRKIPLLVGFFLAFAATTVLIFSHNWIMLIIVITIQAFSLSIIIPVWNATLGDVTEVKGRTTFIGRLSSIGQFVGVIMLLILAGLFFIFDRYDGSVFLGITITALDWKIEYGIVFGVVAINFLICAIGTVFLKETRKNDKEIDQPRMIDALKNKAFRNFIIVNFFFGISMAALWPIYPIIQVNIVGMEFYALTIVSAVYAIFFSFGSFIGGKLGDRFGRKPVMLISRAIMFSVSLLYIPAILTGSWYYVILTNTVSGLGNGVFYVMMNTYALDLSDEKTMGSYSGLSQVTWGIATFIASLLAGVIADVIVNNAITAGYSAIEADERMAIILVIAIAVMRVIATIGYFFIKDSLPKEMRNNSKSEA